MYELKIIIIRNVNEELFTTHMMKINVLCTLLASRLWFLNLFFFRENLENIALVEVIKGFWLERIGTASMPNCTQSIA